MVSWGPGAGPVRVYEGLGGTSVGGACEGRGRGRPGKMGPVLRNAVWEGPRVKGWKYDVWGRDATGGWKAWS